MIKEDFFVSSRMFNTAKLLELLRNGNIKDHRRIFHEFGVGNPVELLELLSKGEDKDHRIKNIS